MPKDQSIQHCPLSGQPLAGTVLAFLCALMALNFLDRTNVGFAALRMNADLGFSPEVFGFGAGLVAIGEALCAVPSGLVAQRFGLARWISLLAVSWGAVAVAMAAVGGARGFFVLRFLLGAAEGGVLPCISSYLSGWIEPPRRGRALAIVSAGSSIAAVIGGPLAGWLFKLDGYLQLPGWRWLFLCEGLPALTAGLLAWYWLPPLAPEPVPPTAQFPREGFKRLFRFIAQSPQILGLGAINFCIATGVLASLLWLPLIAAEIPRLTLMQIGWISAGVFACGALGMLIVGELSDRSGRRFGYLALCLTLATLGYVFAALARDPVTRLIALGAGTTLLRSSAGDFFVGATERLPSALRSGGMGFLGACGGLGGFSGPALLGWAKGQTGSFSAGLLVLGGFVLIGGLLGAWVARDSKPVSQEPTLNAPFQGLGNSNVSRTTRYSR